MYIIYIYTYTYTCIYTYWPAHVCFPFLQESKIDEEVCLSHWLITCLRDQPDQPALDVRLAIFAWWNIQVIWVQIETKNRWLWPVTYIGPYPYSIGGCLESRIPRHFHLFVEIWGKLSTAKSHDWSPLSAQKKSVFHFVGAHLHFWYMRSKMI